ncbi:MAG: sulfotransferase [Desulfomonile tiedjei]|nr:sulfotransferase [Desulfomonile tiedjei]
MEFRFLMLSAMYENGGNTVHRFLDGHPQMYVYPFESQVGSHLVHDHLTSMFPVKYRWPVFDLAATPFQDYKAIIDEECKVRARTPLVSKFQHMPFDLSDEERCDLFVKYVNQTGRSRGGNVAAFFRATFDAWKDYKRSGEEQFYVGYSPIIAVDADKILQDLPHAHVLHVVRNPWSAYADTKKRPVPMSLERYLTAWVTTQYHALMNHKLNPDRVHLVRFEDVVADPQRALGEVCSKLGLRAESSLQRPTWNGEALEEVYPWGTIRRASPEANKATAHELSKEEIEAVKAWAQPYIETFDYGSFL